MEKNGAGEFHEEEALDNVYSEEFNVLFETADWYKKEVEVEIRWATETEEVVTKQKDGDVETTNVAEKGDGIVKNPTGEEYVLKPAQVFKYYDAIEEKPGHYKSKGKPVKAIRLTRDLKIMAPWSEIQEMHAGDWLVDYSDHRTGVDKDAFDATFVKIEPESEAQNG